MDIARPQAANPHSGNGFNQDRIIAKSRSGPSAPAKGMCPARIGPPRSCAQAGGHHGARPTQIPDHPVRCGAAHENCRPPQCRFQGAAPRAQSGGPDHGPRRRDRALDRAQQRQGHLGRRIARQARYQADVQERRNRRLAAHAADQLAQSDQRAEGFRPHGRRAGGADQLVRPDTDDGAIRRPQIRHQSRPWHDPLLQHDQRRPGFRLRQGRQDRPHDADRSDRRGRRLMDHRGQGREAHAAAQDHAGAARPEREVDDLFAGAVALPDEARRLRSER